MCIKSAACRSDVSFLVENGASRQRRHSETVVTSFDGERGVASPSARAKTSLAPNHQANPGNKEPRRNQDCGGPSHYGPNRGACASGEEASEETSHWSPDAESQEAGPREIQKVPLRPKTNGPYKGHKYL